MTESRFALPQLDNVFRLLSRGRHICLDDGEPYWALRDHLADFTDLFSHLGFNLQRHTQDFFYFDGADLSDAGERMAVFVFVLVEHVGDLGLVIEDGLLRHDWTIGQLPHLSSERHTELMTAVDVTDEKGIRAVVQALERFGFAEQLGTDTFRFRKPVHRFLDICIEIAKTSEKGGS